MRNQMVIRNHLALKLALLAITGSSAWCAQPPGAPPVLAVAQKLGADLKAQGYVYPAPGLPATAKTVDCTQFVLKVVEQLVPDLPASARTRISISDLAPNDVRTNKNGIITSGDARTKGVQQALVDLGRGTAVELGDIQPGDLLQYWMRQGDGTWFGHAGVVERTEGTGNQARAWLYGSHLSKKGIGTAPDVGLRLISGEDRRIYAVRFR